MPIRNTFRCDVSWDEMTPVTSGFRHCSQCDRVVADLRWASAEEAARWLALQGGRGCAQVRARPDGTAVFRAGVLLAAGALSITAVGVSVPLTLLATQSEPVVASGQARERPPQGIDPDLWDALLVGAYVSAD